MAGSRKVRVLVVDNEEGFASTLAARLQLRKCKATCAYSGNEALAAIPEFHPDVVILDLQMPDMSGLELLSQIKAMPSLINVILLSGRGSLETGIAGMELGAFDYLVKPVDLDILVARIAEAFHTKCHPPADPTTPRAS